MSNSSDSRTPIIVALITVFGTITVGLLANWDKLFSHGSLPTPAPISSSAMPTELGAENGSPAPLPSPSVGQPALAVTGMWKDSDGYAYRFRVTGSHVFYDQLRDGQKVGSGDGTIDGRTLRYRYRADGTKDSGSCEGLLSTDGSRIDGTCGNGENSWGFEIVRAV